MFRTSLMHAYFLNFNLGSRQKSGKFLISCSKLKLPLLHWIPKLLQGSSLVDQKTLPLFMEMRRGGNFSVEQQGRLLGVSVSRGSVDSLQNVRITLDFQLDQPAFSCNCNISKETKHVALFVFCRDVLHFFLFVFLLCLIAHLCHCQVTLEDTSEVLVLLPQIAHTHKQYGKGPWSFEWAYMVPQQATNHTCTAHSNTVALGWISEWTLPQQRKCVLLQHTGLNVSVNLLVGFLD